MKIIENGKMVGWFENFLILLGLLTSYFSFTSSYVLGAFAIAGLWIGVVIAAFGGYSAKASTLQIKSFGNLTFPKDLPKAKQSKILKVLEWFIEKVSNIIILLVFISIIFWESYVKPYLEIYIMCVTGFVGFVAMIVLFITFKELVRVLKAKKSSLTPSENIEQ